MWPVPLLLPNAVASSLTQITAAFDSATDRMAYVGQSYLSDSISKVYFRVGTVTSGPVVEVRIESVTNGRPSGTLWSANGTGANPKGTVTVSGANTWQVVTLTNAAVLVPGDQFAIVMVYSSGTANFQIIEASSALGNITGGLYPVLLQDTGGGTWGTGLTGACLEWVVEMTTAGVVTMPGMLPLNGSGTITAYNNTTNPNERAMKFVMPFKARVIGLCVGMFNIAAGADCTFSIWNSTDNPGAGPTPLAQTNSLDGDFAYSTTADGLVNVFFTAAVTLTAGTTYYAGVRPDTANNIGLGELSAAGTGAATNAIRAFGIGSNTAHLSTRQWVSTDPGAWADTTTTLPMISLIIDQLDDGAGASGGLLTHPGMAGGMRG